MRKEAIKLRAHHGMCLAFFKGEGYSSEFSAHMQSVLDGMQSNPMLRIVAEKDIICEHCPNLKDGICATPEQVRTYDRQVLSLCGLTENCELSREEFSRLVTNKILAAGKREDICGDCQWSELCKPKELF